MQGISPLAVEYAILQRALAAASAAARSGRRDEAAQRYNDVLAHAGEQPDALNGLGMIALNQAQYPAAAEWFRRAVKADPRSPELRMNLAKAWREQSRAVEERAALEGALAIDQRHFMALVRLAELHERLGEIGEAAERWSNVLAVAELAETVPPAMEAMLTRAREYVREVRAGLADQVDAGLAGIRQDIAAAERHRFDACIDHALGRRRIYHNECAGLHFPFLPANEFFDRAHFPWLDDLEAQTATIRAELEALIAADADTLRPYVAMKPGTPTNKWSPLDHSLDWSALHLWKDGVRDDAVCARVPQTAAVVEALPLNDLPGRTPTVFFSVLRPGAHLPAHSGVSNVRTIIHLPLIVPSDCAFRVGGETRIWEEGRAWAFDDTIEHEAWNNSQSARAILILDVWNPYLTAQEREMLRRFYAVSDAAGVNNRAIGISD